MRRAWTWAAGAAVVGAWLAWRAVPGPESHPAPARLPAPSSTAPRLPRPSPEPVRAPLIGAAAPIEPAASSDEPLAVGDQVTPAAMAGHFDGIVASQPVDATFEALMRDRARAFFGAEEQRGAELRELVCGRDLCRASIALRDGAALDALTDRVAALLPPDTEGYAHIEGDADRMIEVYLGNLEPMLR